MATVRAKMKCVTVELAEDGEGGKILLEPVTSGSAENETFFKYTPSGKVVMSTISPFALKQFVKDEEYYVDFKRASEVDDNGVAPRVETFGAWATKEDGTDHHIYYDSNNKCVAIGRNSAKVSGKLPVEALFVKNGELQLQVSTSHDLDDVKITDIPLDKLTAAVGAFLAVIRA